MIELPGIQARDKHAPDVTPAVMVAIKVKLVGRFPVVDMLVEQDAHPRGIAAKHDKLHAAVVQDGTVRERVGELQGRVERWHGQRRGSGLGGQVVR